MKPLTVLHTESSKGWGSQEIRILQESLEIQKRGYRVLLAAEGDSMLHRKASELGFRVYDVKFCKYHPHSVLKIKEIIEREDVSIINTHSSKDSWISSIAAKIARNRPKIIRTRHLSTPIGRTLFSRIIYEHIPDMVITTGEAIRRRMIEHNRFNPEKIVSIPTGVNLERFNPKVVKPSLERGNFTIGSVGVLRNWKGHEFLLKAIPIISREIPGLRCYIVGDGPQQSNLLSLVKKLNIGDTVVFTGFREDIPEVLASLDILIHPSYANEGVPQAVLQAMAMEVSVVAGNVGGIPEVIIHRETGLLIEPKNEIAIAKAVTELYYDRELREKVVKKGKRLVEKEYSYERMIEKTLEIYRKLLTQGTRS